LMHLMGAHVIAADKGHPPLPTTVGANVPKTQRGSNPNSMWLPRASQRNSEQMKFR